MRHDSTIVTQGGLTITVQPSNHVVIDTGPIIFEGSIAALEAMCESHQQLKKALQLTINLLEDIYTDADISPTLIRAKEALRRAE